MKKLVKADNNPKSSKGTIFYKITLQQLKDAFRESNIWIYKSFDELGFDAIDFEHNLFGSRAISDDVMYLCVTDGYDIEISVGGKTVMQDPETALDYYGPETELSHFIQEGTLKIIQDKITEYEIHTPMFDKWAIGLMNEGHEFTDLMKYAQEYWFNE